MLVEFALLAAGLHAGAYLLYVVQVCRGNTRPNSTTWGIWAFLSLLGAPAYLKMTSWEAAAQLLAGAGACLVAFLTMAVVGRFQRPKPSEWGYLGAGIFAGLIWYVHQDAAAASLIIVAAVVISFGPMLGPLRRDPSLERPLPWWMWSAAFCITIGINVAQKGIWSFGVIAPLVLLLPHLLVAMMTSLPRIATDKLAVSSGRPPRLAPRRRKAR